MTGDGNGIEEAMEVHHRGVIMPWECDDMGHMNIRFHVARYGQALRHAAASGAPFAQARSRRIADRFSFVREARVGMRVACSLRMADEAAEIAACLWDMSSGDVLARFETLVAGAGNKSPAGKLHIDMAWLDMDAEREWTTAMGVLPAPADGVFGTAELLTAAVSDANALAVLELSRGSGYRMDESPVGFVVAELVLVGAGAPPAGAQAFSVRTAFLARSRRSLTFRHRLGAPDGGPDIASARSVCVFFDRGSRQPVPIPFDL